MEPKIYVPETLIEAVAYYSDEQVCFETMVALRWPVGVRCPRCAHADCTLFSTRRVFKCNGCKKQFTVKVGTVFEDSPLGLSKWLPAVWLLACAKNGISSCELARSLGVQQRTAWFMLHRIRHAMQVGSFEKMHGTVEIDETYIGGKNINKHADKKMKNARGWAGKSVVSAVLERSSDPKKASRVRTKIIENTDRKTLKGVASSHVEAGSTVYTDAHSGYKDLKAEFIHGFVDHAIEYVKGSIHTNGLENYFSLLKRTLRGTYVAVEPYHLAAYLDEQSFRYNERKGTDRTRFIKVLEMVSGKRLTYDELTDSYEEYFQQAYQVA